MPAVYLLHFDRPYKHVQHYIGWAEKLDARIQHHRNGTGARLMQVLKAAGIGFTVAKVWPGEDRNFERKLKNRGGARRFCPCCKELTQQHEIESSIEWHLPDHPRS